jgi:Protein of unknown function (DUF2905)
MGKLLIALGIMLVIAGLVIHYYDRIPLLGKLPGDIRIDRGNVKVFIPITTSIIISLVLSLIMFLINKLRG